MYYNFKYSLSYILQSVFIMEQMVSKTNVTIFSVRNKEYIFDTENPHPAVAAYKIESISYLCPLLSTRMKADDGAALLAL